MVFLSTQLPQLRISDNIVIGEMQHRRQQLSPALLLILVASFSIGCFALEEHDGDVKCGCAPCGNPCGASPPPPPPSPPPPTPPPPTSPSTSYCPPPPPPPSYIIGPPGNLYPLDPGYFGGARRSSDARLPVLVVCGLLALWEYWWV